MLCICIGTIYLSLGNSWQDTFSRAALVFFVTVSFAVCVRWLPPVLPACLRCLSNKAAHSRLPSARASSLPCCAPQGFLTFMSISAFPAFAEDMAVFSRERLNGYYQ